MVFVDLCKYLKEKLSEVSEKNYNFSEERQLDSNNLEGEVVVRQLSGSVYDESASIPYQIDITTSDPAKVLEDFTKLALNCNNKSFLSVISQDNENYQSYTITPFFNTPVVMSPREQIGSDIYSRIVVFASINVVYQVSNVESLEIDGEAIKFLQANIIYTAELKSNRDSGEELNKNKKFQASTLLSFSLVNKATVFCNTANQIILGKKQGNTSFTVKVKMTNGIEATLKMMCGSATLNSTRGQLPSLQVGMYIYDDRGDSNNASS